MPISETMEGGNMKKRPVLTLLKSNAIYDFSKVTGQKKELNGSIQEKLDSYSKKQAKALVKLKSYRIGTVDQGYQKIKSR